MNKIMIKLSALLLFTAFFTFDSFSATRVLKKLTINNRPVEIVFEVDNGWSDGYYHDSNGVFIGSDNGDVYLRAYYTDVWERCYEPIALDYTYKYTYYDRLLDDITDTYEEPYSVLMSDGEYCVGPALKFWESTSTYEIYHQFFADSFYIIP